MVFSKYAKVYDLLNEDKKYEKEALEVINLLSEHTKEKELFVIGCGTGKHDKVFAQAGYKVKGIDLSSEMIKIAQKNNQAMGIEYEVSDIRHYQTQKKYMAVVSLFHVMSYMVDTQDLRDALRSAAMMMKAGGILIFDAWHGPGVLSDKPTIRVKRVQDSDVEVMRIAEPTLDVTTNTVNVHYDITVSNKGDYSRENFEETHLMRYLFIPEIEYILQEVGLKIIDCLDCKTLRKPDSNSWTVYFIAVKE